MSGYGEGYRGCAHRIDEPCAECKEHRAKFDAMLREIPRICFRCGSEPDRLRAENAALKSQLAATQDRLAEYERECELRLTQLR